jgi:hypothetical protein
MDKAHPATSGTLIKMFNAIAVPMTFSCQLGYIGIESNLTSAISVAMMADSAKK